MTTNPQIESQQAQARERTGSSREREVQAWLVNRIARELEINPQEIDIRAPFSRYGLDSLAAVHLVANMEEWLGLELSPTLPYDYPTVEALAGHIGSLPGKTDG